MFIVVLWHIANSYDAQLELNNCHTLSGTLTTLGWPYFSPRPLWPPNAVSYGGYYDLQTNYGSQTQNGPFLPVCSCSYNSAYGENSGPNPNPGCSVVAASGEWCYDLSWIPSTRINSACPSVCRTHDREHLYNICIPRNNNMDNRHGLCVCKPYNTTLTVDSTVVNENIITYIVIGCCGSIFIIFMIGIIRKTKRNKQPVTLDMIDSTSS